MNGYNFDPGSFQEVRQTWHALRDGLKDDLAAAKELVDVVAPGHEPASGFVASTQNDSGKALLDAIKQMQAFVEGYVSGLGQSEHEYQALETSGIDTFQGGER